MSKNFLEKVQKKGPAGRKRKDRKGNRTRQKNKREDSKVETNGSPEIPGRGETSDIPDLPSRGNKVKVTKPATDPLSPYKVIIMQNVRPHLKSVSEKANIQVFLKSSNRSIISLEYEQTLNFVLLGSKLYDSSSVGEFLAHTFHTGDSLFILLSMWASYSPRESPGMLATQSLTMTPETKHSPTKQHRTDNASYNRCQ